MDVNETMLALLKEVLARWESIPERDQVNEEMNDDDLWDRIREVLDAAGLQRRGRC